MSDMRCPCTIFCSILSSGKLRQHTHWALVPDGVLYRLPFEALITRILNNAAAAPSFVINAFKELSITYFRR